MRKVRRLGRWVGAGSVLIAFGGCVSEQQWLDFVRTEFARVAADMLGRAFSILTQATT